MKGDFTRDTFDASNHFTRVLMQQGRVQLDADWNEQAAILLHYLQSLATDLIGPHGGPEYNLGFEIEAVDGDVKNFKIGTGRYYVQGILCENEAHWNADGTQLDSTYENQPNYQPLDELPDPPFLIYLDVWERHLTYLEMEDSDGSVVSIRESALGPGGPDTATRAQVVWQVKAKKTNFTVKDTKDYERFRKEVQPKTGRLKAQAIPATSAQEEACITPPESRYRGMENQLYRVEVHRGGYTWNGVVEGGKPAGNAATAATFKWSRENGSVIFPIREVGDKSVKLETLGRDTRLGLQVGDWVEIVDDVYTLQNRAEPLLRVETIDYDANLVTLSASPSITVVSDLNTHPLLRRWDHKENVSTDEFNYPILADDGALLVEEKKWLFLEDGIQIFFEGTSENETPHRYCPGDYWLIPARTATGDVEWPGPVGEPVALEPRGIKHHYAPLWIISAATDSSITVNSANDLRRPFKQLWMLPS